MHKRHRRYMSKSTSKFCFSLSFIKKTTPVDVYLIVLALKVISRSPFQKTKLASTQSPKKASQHYVGKINSMIP